MKVPIVLFPASRYFLDLKHKYLLQHPASEKPSDEAFQLWKESSVFICPGAHKIQNKTRCCGETTHSKVRC